MKPLYYTQTSERVLFASELKSLLCDPAIPRTIDHKAIQKYLTALYSPGERTPL